MRSYKKQSRQKRSKKIGSRKIKGKGYYLRKNEEYQPLLNEDSSDTIKNNKLTNKVSDEMKKITSKIKDLTKSAKDKIQKVSRSYKKNKLAKKILDNIEDQEKSNKELDKMCEKLFCKYNDEATCTQYKSMRSKGNRYETLNLCKTTSRVIKGNK
jgi:hypothetical protein